MSDIKYTTDTYYFDYHSAEIQEIISEFQTDSLGLKEKVKQLYLKVRDEWRYDPYYISFSKEAYRASATAKKQSGHCLEKSILLIACLRALGIPARIHLAKVKNHIGVERLLEKFGTNELTPHGMINVYLDGKWLKASPAFNKALCEKCNVAPLAFDGENDSMFQEYNNEGNVFMEYLEDYGHFDDVPFDFILSNLRAHYPDIIDKHKGLAEVRL